MRFATTLRSCFAALVALPLLAAPALAATNPAAAKGTTPVGRRPVAARPVAVAPAKAAAKRVQPAAAPVVAAAEATAAPADVKLVVLAGIVTGADGLPCPGACVFPVTNTRQIAVTDAQGQFQLQVPAGATLRLQADYFGLGSSRLDFDGQTPQPVRITLGR